MLKYKLSRNIVVSPIDDNAEGIPSQYQQEHYFLYDEVRDKEFLINSTIKYFIDKFSSPKTEAEILREIEADVNGSSKELEETCSTFFKFLTRKRIIIPEDQEEYVILREPLFNEGDSIDQMVIKEVLSSRQFIDIYLARDKNSDKDYVVKLLNNKKTLNSHIFSRELSELQKEYSMLKAVESIPALCRVYDFKCVQEQYAYITLEFIRGKALADFIEEAELNEKDCTELIAQILNAFSSLHESGLIHGDIHSSNILVEQDKRVRVIDLGLSRNVEIEKNEILHFGGVNFYMPPERINISSHQKYLKEPDLYSDVYQIGLLMYLVLYNDLPFDGFIWEELAQNIKESDALFPSVSFLNYLVSEDMIRVVKKCLSKEPAERYKNAGEIMSDFKKNAFAEKELTAI